MEFMVARLRVNTVPAPPCLASPLMSDLPGDPWAALLVGHHWPGSSALAILSAAAASRHAVGASFHGYADALRSVADTVLSDQEGHTADGVRTSFRSGETHARGVAERNTAKREALTRAQHCASELRSTLAEMADRGGRQIRTIVGGKEPAPAKVSAIVDVVRAIHTEADARAAVCMQEIYGSIQSVLDTGGSPISARQFAHRHGVGTRSPHTAAPTDAIHQQVKEMLEKDSGAAESVADVLGGSSAFGRIPLPAGADKQPSAPSPEQPGLTVAAPIPAAAIPTAHSLGGQTAVTTAAAPVSSSPVRTGAAPAARPLLPYGAGLRPTAGSAVAAPASAPRNAAPTAGPTTAAAAAFTRTSAPAGTTVERARPTDSRGRLTTVLHAVARQRPTLRWAVSAAVENPVLATDLASGWIPPHIDIPAAVELLSPAARTGGLIDWFDKDAATVIHDPGQWVPPPGDPVLARDRAIRPVAELGWKLLQATSWRDGLPRLAHTAARAIATGAGLLDSEVNQLRGHLESVGHRVIAGYPDTVNIADVGDWQLLATIEALVDRESVSAHYHFAWFEALHGSYR